MTLTRTKKQNVDSGRTKHPLSNDVKRYAKNI